jgi:hypothetical protein
MPVRRAVRGKGEQVRVDNIAGPFAATVFGLALAADLATKALLPQVTYFGVGAVSFAPAPLWLAVPAVASLMIGSRLLTAAACLTLAGVVGNAISASGDLDFGRFGAWTLASVFLALGLATMAVALGMRLPTLVSQSARRGPT